MMTLRALRRSLLYSATVILLLGIGVGASGLIFTAVEAFLLRPLPVERPEQLARLGVEASATHITFDHSTVYASVLSERAQSAKFVFTTFPMDSAMVANGQISTVACDVVSDNFFTALGLHAEAGTFFQNSAYPDGGHAAVISDSLWRGAFGGQDRAIGSAIRLRGATFTIVGVAPREFGGLDLERRVDVWVPAHAWQVWTGSSDSLHEPAQIFLRLRTAVPLQRAETEVRVLYPAMVEADLTSDRQPHSSAEIERQKERRPVLISAKNGISAMRKQLLPAVPVLLGGIVLLLVLIAANVGGLMLVRTETRTQDIALRLSLGASRLTVIRELVSESLLLAGIGALLACAIVALASRQVAGLLPVRYPLAVVLQPNLKVVSAMILGAACVGVLASFVPALLVARGNLTDALSKAGTRVASIPRSGRMVVAVQVAVATLLVASAAAFVGSLNELRKLDPGFDRSRLIVAVLDSRLSAIPTKDLPSLYDEVLRKAHGMPGTIAASLSGYPLMRGVGYRNTMGPAGTRLTADDRLNVSLNYASETHFQNLGVRLISGRTIIPSDLGQSPTPVVVTEAFAKKFFRDSNALGHDFGPTGPDGLALPKFRIVGVISDLKYRGMRESPPPTFYSAFNGQEELVTLYIRTKLNDAEAIRQTRAMLAGVGHGLSAVSVATMEQEIERSLWQERLLSAVSQLFGIVAALTAASGLFGLISFTLARRRREVGIRMAIGATQENIAALFSKHAAAAFAPGLLIGCTGFLIVRAAVGPLVFDAGRGLLRSLITSVALMLIVAICAVTMPVLRAIGLHPLIALREE